MVIRECSENSKTTRPTMSIAIRASVHRRARRRERAICFIIECDADWRTITARERRSMSNFTNIWPGDRDDEDTQLASEK